MPNPDIPSLKRDIQVMPDNIRRELEQRKLTSAYEARPPYQRNDYLAWIARAKRPETRQKRLDQMLDELREGGHYMGMQWSPGDKVRA